jgi:hypothetical protein
MAAKQDRPDVARERSRWRGWQRFMDPACFVFLDETGTATDMARRYGRGSRGERAAGRGRAPRPLADDHLGRGAPGGASAGARHCST